MRRPRWIGRGPAVLVLALVAACGPAANDARPPPAPKGVAPAVRPLVIDPVVPGWSSGRSPSVAAAYDLPPGWLVRTDARAITAEARPGQTVPADGLAYLPSDACGGSAIASTGITYAPGDDLDAAARDTAQAWGSVAFHDQRKRPPTLTVGDPEPITTLDGRPAVTITVTARPASAVGPCKASGGVAHAIAATGFTGANGPIAVLVLITDTGRPDTVPDDQIRRILTSLRPG